MSETIALAPSNITIGTIARLMAANGYRIVPISLPAPNHPNDHVRKSAGKAPGFSRDDGRVKFYDGWQWNCDNNTSPDDLQAFREYECGIGLAGGIITGIDLDIIDDALVEKAERIVTAIVGSTITRFGRAPKRTLIYRAAETVAGKSFKWRMPDGAEHGLDIVGHGRQSVAFGIHPGTMKPYTWRDGCDPSNTKLSALPTISQAQVDQIIAALAALMVEAGYVAPVKSEPVRRDPSLSYVVTPSSTIATNDELLRFVVDSLPNDYGRDEWVKIGLAIHTEGGDFGLFDAWSRKHPSYDAKATAAFWKHCEKSNRRANTFGTLLHYFRERVGDLPPALEALYRGTNIERARVGDLIEVGPTIVAPEAEMSEDDIGCARALAWAEEQEAEESDIEITLPVAPASLPSVPLPQLLTIAKLRENVLVRVRENLYHSCMRYEAYHYGHRGREKFLIEPQRFVMAEAMGSGKSTSFAKVIHENKHRLTEGLNILAIMQSGDRADDLEGRLADLPVRNVRAAPLRCDDAVRLPQVKQLSNAGLSVEIVCKKCPMKKAGSSLFQVGSSRSSLPAIR